ncbi:LytTR family transcriptional regulator [Lachnospiraceae bacterium MD308]|nr:LytTR family transcriptional regulator [Lachnospiraceae bacterium MD308]
MNWLEKISTDNHLYNDLASFLDQYEISGLQTALQLYRTTHQTYICRTKQDKQSIIKINIYDIIYLEIQKHDISVHTTHGTYHKYGSLVNELKNLSPYGFLRCTKNCIVSMNHIQSIHGDDIHLIDGTQIHMSRKYASTIIIAFSQSKPLKM